MKEKGTNYEGREKVYLNMTIINEGLSGGYLFIHAKTV